MQRTSGNYYGNDPFVDHHYHCVIVNCHYGRTIVDCHYLRAVT